MERFFAESPELIVNCEWEFKDLGEFPFEEVEQWPEAEAHQGDKKNGRCYVNRIGGIDLENSGAFVDGELHGVPYIHQLGIYAADGTADFICVLFRTKRRMQLFMDELAFHLRGRTLQLFDFNLSYEYSFYRSWFPFVGMFFKDVKHPLKGYSHPTVANDAGCFEWRDAQALFGPGGLAGATKGLPHEKLSGDLDYSVARYPWTVLDDKESEIRYPVYDVWGLCEAVYNFMQKNGGVNKKGVYVPLSQYGLKLTFTGLVRKDMNKILFPMRRDNKPITRHDCAACYDLICGAKRGGNTHSNMWFVADEVFEEEE